MNAKEKAALAIAKIFLQKTHERSFDDLFENGDGELVVTFIIETCNQNARVRNAVADWHGGELIDGMPKAWVETYKRIRPTLIPPLARQVPPDPVKLYAIIPLSKTKGELPARFDLAPMNHAAACNWMDACRDEHTDYRLIDWPAEIPHPKSPQFAERYRQ